MFWVWVLQGWGLEILRAHIIINQPVGVTIEIQTAKSHYFTLNYQYVKFHVNQSKAHCQIDHMKKIMINIRKKESNDRFFIWSIWLWA